MDALPVFSVLLCCLVTATGLYVDHGYPYQAGTLRTKQLTLSDKQVHCPLHAVVLYPTTPGDYAVAFFIPGFDGLILSEMYFGYLISIAQHGFIVIGSDYFFPETDPVSHDQRLDFIADKYMEQFFWMSANLQGHLKANVDNVTSDWNHVGLFSHSAGADSVFKMAERNHTLFQSIVFYEPMSFMFTQPTTFSLPALIVGTQLSTVYHDCIIPGYGYNHFYKMWAQPPKVLMEVKSFGHCDILDDTFRKFCTDVKFCIGGNATSMPSYHRFAQGVTSAFFIASLQGYQSDFRYVTDQKNIPLQLLELKVNMTS